MKLHRTGKIWFTIIAVIVIASSSACPKKPSSAAEETTNPPFFHDAAPAEGPWEAEQHSGKDYYAKIYTHEKLPVMIVTSIVTMGEIPPVDVSDPTNQKLLAESALKGLCAGVESKCLVRNSDLAWIIGSPFTYVYVRFRAQKPGAAVMPGLLYYRFDPPVQTMYMLLAGEEFFNTYESVFADYVSATKLNLDRR